MRRAIRILGYCFAVGVLPLLVSLPAAAVLVTVNAVDYDVTVYEGSYDDYPQLFREPPIGRLPWWGDATGLLASQFALQVYDGLGLGSYADSGPIFAYLYDPTSGRLEGLVQSLLDPNAQDIFSPLGDAVVKYAIIYLPPVSAPVPSPLPWFGGLAALRASRTLRRLLSR
jgi:hypothetical protein